MSNKEFRYKQGLRQRDKKRIVEQSLKEGILSKSQIEKVIRVSKHRVKNHDRCYVCGKEENTKVCSRCKNYHYCSRKHQEEDWKDHRQICHIFRYCLEDHKMYLHHDKVGKKLDLYPLLPLKTRLIDRVNSWDEYFFQLRHEHYNQLFRSILKKPIHRSKSKYSKKQWVEFPEFRNITKKMSLSMSIYHALELMNTKKRNNILSIVVPFYGPANTDILELVKEFACLMTGVRSLGITFAGDGLPTKEEITQISYDAVGSYVSVYMWKKRYQAEDMDTLSPPDLVVLESRRILHERLEILFDLLVNEMNVLILFNSYKYYSITLEILEDILGIRIESSGPKKGKTSKKKCSRSGANPFMSFEFVDPCKKVNPGEIVCENQYFILLTNYSVEEKKLERKVRKFLAMFVERGSGQSIEEVLKYMTFWKWGFCGIKDIENGSSTEGTETNETE